MKLIHSISAAFLFALAHPLPGAITEEATFPGATNPFAALGYSVAFSGDTAVVGAPSIDFAGDSSRAGSAVVYVRSGGTWTQQATLTPSAPANGNWFGNAVAIEGNTIVVGAPGEQSGAGAAYVFTRSGTTWTQRVRLQATFPITLGHFGTSVAISGNTVAVGSAHPRSQAGSGYEEAYNGERSAATGVDGDESNTAAVGAGAVFVFQRKAARWHLEAYLKASNTNGGDNFGFSVALAGDTLVVGAPGEDSAAGGVNGNQASNDAPQSGAAYVFTRANGAWTQQAYLKQNISNSERGFGYSTAISGETIAVGSFDLVGPGAFVFTRSPAGVWSQQAALSGIVPGREFGYSVALWRDTLVVGEIFPGAGAAHVFRRDFAGAWTRQTVITPATPSSDGYGASSAIEGEVIVVGTATDEFTTSGSNRVWMYGGAGESDLAAEQPAGVALPTGGTRTLGQLPGSATDVVFTLRNTGVQPLTFTGTPDRVAVSGSSDFTVTAQPAATVSFGGSTTFTVRFAPTTAGLKTATLSIPNNDPDEAPYVINLTGRGLSYTTDTDGDGMSDAAEFQLASLGYDWQVAQSALVADYFANANNNGLYTTSQVQALHVGTPLIQRNAATGKFTLTIGVKKTAVLGQPFADFPMSGPGTGVFINGAGKLEFEFPAPGNAAFFRLESQ